MRNRTKHELSWLTAISDAGSTPAASTILKSFYINDIPPIGKFEGHFCT